LNALIITNVQNDFCPGGALAIREGDRIVPLKNHSLSFTTISPRSSVSPGFTVKSFSPQSPESR
jgi:hypothetical protein